VCHAYLIVSQTAWLNGWRKRGKLSALPQPAGEPRKRSRPAKLQHLSEPNLLILLGLAVVTFGIYAQLIGHRFITIDDLAYIEGNPIVNRGVTLGGTRLGVYHFSRGELASTHVDRTHDR